MKDLSVPIKEKEPRLFNLFNLYFIDFLLWKLYDSDVKNKTILKYNTIIDWAKAGVDSVTATIEVKVTPQREVGFDAIAERIYRFDEVRSVYLMSGSYDLLVVIEGNSLREVANFVSTRLAPIDGVISTTSHFMLKAYKKDGAILNDKENDHRLVVSP